MINIREYAEKKGGLSVGKRIRALRGPDIYFATDITDLITESPKLKTNPLTSFKDLCNVLDIGSLSYGKALFILCRVSIAITHTQWCNPRAHFDDCRLWNDSGELEVTWNSNVPIVVNPHHTSYRSFTDLHKEEGLQEQDSVYAVVLHGYKGEIPGYIFDVWKVPPETEQPGTGWDSAKEFACFIPQMYPNPA